MRFNKKQLKINSSIDQVFFYFTQLFAIFLLILLGGFFVFLYWGSSPAINHFGWDFIISTQWNPVTQQFGALVPIMGTLATSAIALLIGVPTSFGIAIFLTELCPVILQQPLRISIELLAGIPSIIYGMWGLFVFAPLFGHYIQPWLIAKLGHLSLIGPLFQGVPLGIGILTAGIILGIMIIPFMASVMRDVFEMVPDMLKESAYGVGATTWEVIWHIVLPYTRTGVIGGIILGLGRALGETMAVAFVIGNAHQFSLSILMPGNSIASVLANEFTEATETLYSASLVELGFILFLMTFVVLTFSKLLLRRLEKC